MSRKFPVYAGLLYSLTHVSFGVLVQRKLVDGMFDTMPPEKRVFLTDLRSTDDVILRRPNGGGFRTLEEQLQVTCIAPLCILFLP